MPQRYFKSLISVLLVLALLLSVPLTGLAAELPDQEPTAVGDGGAVATEHPAASEAAITILKNGGNAVDAAVAAAAAQGVTRPYSGGIGGGGFMHVYLEEEDQSVILDHVTETSQNFGPDSYINPETGALYPSAVRSTSGMATGIPGAVKAWEQALEEYGTMTLSEVLQPAIEVAEEGFVADDNFIRETTENADRFRLFNSTREIYLDENGDVPEVGTVVKNPDLAKTYRLIAEHGSEVFYEGEIAEAIIDTIHNPPVVENPDHEVLAGNMTMDDLIDYEVITRDPTHTTYRGYDVYSVPPSSSGVTISEILNIMEAYDLANMPKTQALHYYLEASRFAFADRSAYMGDPAHTLIPVEGLISKGYAAERRQNIRDDYASIGRVAPGNPWPYNEDPDKQPDPPPVEDHAFYYDFSGNDGDPWDPTVFANLHSFPSSPPGATFSIQQNTGQVVLDQRQQGNGSAYGRANPGMRALEDSELLVRFRFDELGNDQRLRLWIQADAFSSGSTMAQNGYGIELNAGTKRLLLRGREDGRSTTFGSIDTDLTTDWHWLRLRAHGDQLSVRLWNDENDEPNEWNIVHELSESEQANNAFGVALLSFINFDYDSGNTIYLDEVIVNDLGEQPADPSESEEPTETIHLSVTDRDGNIVSYTSTINSIGGNGMVVPGYGFLLNNGFSGRIPSQDPDHPNYPRPGLRMLSAMSPTIVMKDGNPVMEVGAPSSNRIITTIVQIIMNHLDFGMTLPEAIDEPRLSQRNLSSARAEYEEVFRDKYGTLLDELEDMGHTFTADTAVQGISAATGLEFLEDGRVRAAAEPTRRGGGSAMALDIGDIEDPPADEASVARMKSLVEQFETEGEITNAQAARLLQTHLTAVGHYEQTGSIEKAIKHMEGLKQLLDHQLENAFISDKAYNALYSDAETLIEKWQ
mgnify:CR=1 FL=1